MKNNSQVKIQNIQLNKTGGKKMKKKFLTFGLLGLFALALVSAALVSYLSNTVEGEVEIRSPLVMAFDGDSYGTTAEKHFGITYGGESFTYKTWTKNLANAEIFSYHMTVFESDNDWTGEEFTSVLITDNNGGPHEILEMLYVVQDGGNLKKFTAGNWNVANKKRLNVLFDNTGTGTPQKWSRPIGFEESNIITTTTHQAISPGDYKIETCQLDDYRGTC